MRKAGDGKDAMYCVREGGILLRDMVESDIADYLHWETVETEWQLWDAPWDYEGRTEERRAEELQDYRAVLEMRACAAPLLEAGMMRTNLEICLDDATDPARATHIGGLGSYRIDGAFRVSEDGPHRAIGIDICDMRARGKGYAAIAMRLFIDQFRAHGLRELYCQTWSGNVRMICLAEKLGFRECCRKKGIRSVRGGTYDGLSFRLPL